MHNTLPYSSQAPKMVPFDPKRLPPLSAKEREVCLERVNRTPSFDELRTRHIGDDLRNYRQQTDRFVVNRGVEQVWQTYTRRQGHELWGGPRVRFLFSYSKRDKQFYYESDIDAPVAHPGQQFFCLLHFGYPVGVVGMELLQINDADKVLELAYLEGGLYRGVQYVYFKSNGPMRTTIEHVSYQWGEYGWVRTLIPYKYLHRLTVGEFHAALRQRIEAS